MIFEVNKFYKHPNTLIGEEAGINYLYGLLNKYAISEGYIFSNPIFLITSYCNFGEGRLNGREGNKIKVDMQFLLDGGYISIYKPTDKGIIKSSEYSFIPAEGKQTIKSSDGILLKVEREAIAQDFTKVYMQDLEKLNTLRFSDATKSFHVYLSIMKRSYCNDVIKVSFGDIKKTTGIKTNKAVSRIVEMLNEKEVLAKTNNLVNFQEGCYVYARYCNKHLLGAEEKLKEKEEERETRNAKRRYATFKLEEAEDLFGSNDYIEPEAEEKVEEDINYEEEVFVEEYPYSIIVHNDSCPSETYLSVDKNGADFYINNSRCGGGAYKDIVDLITSKKVIDNKNSIIHKLAKEDSNINVLLKDNKSKEFLKYLSSKIILKNVVAI